MKKDIELFDLLKIPDKELLKKSQQEIGKLSSYVEELELEIEKFKNKLNEGIFITNDELKMYNFDIKLIQEKLYYKKIHEKLLNERLKNKQLSEKYNLLIYQLSIKKWKKLRLNLN